MTQGTGTGERKWVENFQQIELSQKKEYDVCNGAYEI